MNDRIQHEEDLQDYLDGRLDARRKIEIDAYLQSNPDAAEYVNSLRRQNEALQRFGSAILEEPVPDKLRAIVRRTATPKAARSKWHLRRQSLQAAAAALVIFVIGGGGGWWLHGVMSPVPSQVQALLQSSSYALTFYGSEKGFPIGFSPEQSEELASWIEKIFGKTVPYPDLSANKYQYSGGNILPGADGETIFYLYSRSQGVHISVIAWASDEKPSDSPTVAELGDFAASYWHADGLGYAVLGSSSDQGLSDVSNAIYKFYNKTKEN